MRSHSTFLRGFAFLFIFLMGCSAMPKTPIPSPSGAPTPLATTLPTDTPLNSSPTPTATQILQDVTATASPSPKPTQPTSGPIANVIAVQTSGSPNAYQFSVSVSSPDQGCQQYADWWEVLSSDGELLYRRILLHSHTNEQPFTRQGGPVRISADTLVWVRAHMNTGGYGGTALMGSVERGFQQAELSPDFALDVETQAPLPDGCAF